VWTVRLEDATVRTWLTSQKVQDMVHLEAGFVTRALPPITNIPPGPAEVNEATSPKSSPTRMPIGTRR
jgi:hypothetical protein